MLWEKILNGLKYFIGHKYDEKVNLLYIGCQRMTEYVNSCKETKYNSYLIKNNQLLQNTIKFDIKSAIQCNIRLIVNQCTTKNTWKLMSHGSKSNTNFHCNKIPKEGSCCMCLSALVIDLVYKINKNYWPKVFLEECKYIEKERNLTRGFTEDVKTSSDEMWMIKNLKKF